MVKRRCSVVAAVVVTCITTLSPGRATLKERNRFAPEYDEPLFRIWDARGKEGFIDVRGHIVIATLFDTVTAFHEGLAPVKKGGKWGYIDRTGQMIIPAQWRYAGFFIDGLAPVANNEMS
jgi:hypothetical protein